MMTKSLITLLAVALPLTAAAEDQPEPRQSMTTIESFDYGRTYVHTSERTELRRIAKAWRLEQTKETLVLEGHGYVEQDEEASIALGAKRAERVRALLVKYGVDARYIITVGHSRAKPGRYVDIVRVAPEQAPLR